MIKTRQDLDDFVIGYYDSYGIILKEAYISLEEIQSLGAKEGDMVLTIAGPIKLLALPITSPKEPPPENKTFQQELESLINRYSKENESNTPDFILAEYLKNCLDAFNKGINAREIWHGRENKSPGTGKYTNLMPPNCT